MTDRAPPEPRGPARQDDRDARLKAALKANLARRKSQARARATTDGDDNQPPASGQDKG